MPPKRAKQHGAPGSNSSDSQPINDRASTSTEFNKTKSYDRF